MTPSITVDKFDVDTVITDSIVPMGNGTPEDLAKLKALTGTDINADYVAVINMPW